jgi:hypothetical protein
LNLLLVCASCVFFCAILFITLTFRDLKGWSEGIGSVGALSYPISLSVRSLHVSFNEPRCCTMPARLTIRVCFTLARAVHAVDSAGRRENQKRSTIEMHVWILFDLLLSLNNSDLPSARARNLVERILNYLLHSCLIHIYHLCLAPYQLK